MCTALLGCCLNVFGQCQTVGTTIDESDPSSVVVDTDFSEESRKLFVVGYNTRESMEFAGVELTGAVSTDNSEGNMFILQHSENGLDWLKPIGRAYSNSTSARVKATSNGAIVGVKFIDTVTVGSTHISSGYENALLLRMDNQGDVLWVRHLDSDGLCRVSDIETDDYGNIYAYGHYQDNLRIGSHSIQATGSVQQTQAELFLAKFNSDGVVVWLRHFGGGTAWDDAENLEYKDEKLYLSGFFAGDITIGSTTLTSSSNHNGFLCKADSSGDAMWVRQLISGTVRELAVECINNEVLLAGVFQEQMTVGTNALNANGSRDGFIALFDSLGSVEWIRSIGGVQNDAVAQIEKVTDELFLLSGRAVSDFVIDGNEFINSSTVGQGTAFTLLMDIEGVVRCINPFPSSDESHIWVSHVSADTVWQVGLYQSDVTVGDTSFNCPMPCGASFFVAKACMGCNELIRLDMPTYEKPIIQFEAYPNPTTNFININLSANQKPAAIGMLDMLGREVLRQPFAPQIDLSSLLAGNYVLAVYTEDGVLRKRVVISR